MLLAVDTSIALFSPELPPRTLARVSGNIVPSSRPAPQVFGGIPDWPDIDAILAEKAKQLIKQHGVQDFVLAGGLLRPDGLPSFGSPSVAAFRGHAQVR